MAELTHFDPEGRPSMVDVGDKPVTAREATAQGRITMSAEARAALIAGRGPKGDARTVAQLAGVQAAKDTARLIPLCHILPLDKVAVEIEPEGETGFHVTARVRATAKTGVEMEALTAVSVACLTLYDMGKALDKAMTIHGIALGATSGGRSGDYRK
ncbi:MAG: cyclic pyranopterin monophosphate synthase MoaC [Maricaulaceae bacterium]